MSTVIKVPASIVGFQCEVNAVAMTATLRLRVGDSEVTVPVSEEDAEAVACCIREKTKFSVELGCG